MNDSFETPLALAFIACDTIITDAQTGKKSLIGIFNSAGAARFPHILPQFFIFASMTNGNGDTEVRVQLSAADNSEIFNLKGRIPFKTPLDCPEMIFGIQNLVIKAPGTYELRLLANDVLVASRLLTFRELRVPPPPAPQP